MINPAWLAAACAARRIGGALRVDAMRVRAKGMVSRTWSRPQIHATARSCPCRSRSGDAAVTAQVEVPLEGLFGQIVVLDAGVEKLETGDALGASDDFAVAFGARTSTQRRSGILRVRLHIEGFTSAG